MNKTKLGIIIGVLTLGLLVTGCNSNPASLKATEKYLDEFKTGSIEENSSLGRIYSYINGSNSTEVEKSDNKKFVKLIFGSFNYKVLATKESGDNSTIKINLNAYDIMEVMIQKNNMFKESDSKVQSTSESLKMYEDVYKLTDLKKREVSFDVNMIRQGDIWKVTNETELVDAISGGAVSILLGGVIPNQ